MGAESGNSAALALIIKLENWISSQLYLLVNERNTYLTEAAAATWSWFELVHGEAARFSGCSSMHVEWMTDAWKRQDSKALGRLTFKALDA